ncbi:MAG: hypothetical protein ACUVQ8_06090 [Nitrososphaeria archaeon]
MTEKEKTMEDNEMEHEEIRSLFTLGLMVVLVSYRIGFPQAKFELLGSSFSLTPIIDSTLVF